MRYIMRRTRTKALCFGETDMSEDLGMDAAASPPPATLLQMMTGY